MIEPALPVATPAPPGCAGEPREAAPDVLPVTGRGLEPPAIYHVPRPVLGAFPGWAGAFARAGDLGFDTVLLGSVFAAVSDPSAPRAAPLVTDFDAADEAFGGGAAFDVLAAAARDATAAGVSLAMDMDAGGALAPDGALAAAHPDWFVATTAGAAFRFLSASDVTVDWWDGKLASWQAAGVRGFRCVDAVKVPGAVWARLISAARARDSAVMFIAETAGAAPAAIAGLRDAGFDFTQSSSCYWDFAADWLNEDAGRLEAVAPMIAMAGPPGAAGWTGEAVLRAVRFAASYGAGWLLEAGFCEAHGLEEAVRQLNALRRRMEVLRDKAAARLVSSPGAAMALLRRGGAALTVAVNPSLSEAVNVPAAAVMPALGLTRLHRLNGAPAVTPAAALALGPGEVAMYTAAPAENVFMPVAIALDCDVPRIAIEDISPQVDGGQFPVRRVLGELVTVQADLIADGHDKLAAEVLFRAMDEPQFQSVPMALVNNDRWAAQFPLERMGSYEFAVVAWKDVFATFVDEVTKKHAAGVNTALELQEGTALLREAAHAGMRHVAPKLQAVLEQLDAADEETRRGILLSADTQALVRAAGVRKFAVTSGKIIVDAERAAASFASWYEIFPRSQSGDPARHGNFIDVIRALPRIAAMGFDVLYFPPIHPIGRVNRKGRNNTLTPGPDDPGSPYAIGNEAGGHEAIHPELGTMADFHRMRDAAAALGIELALDFAIQCAPDHPWLKEHPEWFDWRPDGSLRYAENPPKKYEDIVNVDFYAEGAKPSLWLALRDVVQFWCDQGVRLFRVDNPHTKPLPFWEWLIADIRSRHPDAVFLAEAFTRPKVMYRLAKIGFSQSYTYFTWRNTKAELQDYMTELDTTAPKEFFRPHFFVNTPDINPVFLQTSGRGGFLIRAALAATLSGLWGVYNGFELCEATPVAAGKEEYLNSEKYEIKAWDYDRPGNIVAEISRLNRIRRANAALHTHLNVEFVPTDNDKVICFRKFAADGNNILVAISLDPHNVQTAVMTLPLWRFGVTDEGALQAEDLMRDFRFTWHGKFQNVTLNPDEQPFCIWRISA